MPCRLCPAVWTIRPSTMKPHHQGGSPRKWRPTPS